LVTNIDRKIQAGGLCSRPLNPYTVWCYRSTPTFRRNMLPVI